MTLVSWDPEPAPFGSARGLDYVGIDVYCRIAHRFGATVTVGKLPADCTASYGEAAPGSKPVPLITVGRGGVTAYRDAHCSASGSTAHDWRAELGPDTLVVDTRTIPDDRIVSFATRGPMVDVGLEARMMSTLGPIGAPMNQVADAYLAPYGGLAATDAQVTS